MQTYMLIMILMRQYDHLIQHFTLISERREGEGDGERKRERGSQRTVTRSFHRTVQSRARLRKCMAMFPTSCPPSPNPGPGSRPTLPNPCYHSVQLPPDSSAPISYRANYKIPL